MGICLRFDEVFLTLLHWISVQNSPQSLCCNSCFWVYSKHLELMVMVLCVCLFISLNVERKVPMILAQDSADWDFAIDASFKSYGVICLPWHPTRVVQ